MSSQCPACGTLTSSAESNVQVPTKALALHRKLLTTNEAPESAEISFIRSVVSNADTRLVRLDTEISQLRDRLRQLEKERTALSAYRAENNAVLSPLRRMPPEVLGEIFSWTLPSVSDLLAVGHRGFDVGKSPWVLTHTSSHWRAVAISTSPLWSLVAIDYNLSSRYPLPMLETQLARARSLKIHFYGREGSASRPQIAIFLSLAKRSFFWEELSISLTSNLFPLLSTLRNRVPSLRRLWMHWDGAESQKAVRYIDCFQSAPSLFEAGIRNQWRTFPILLPSHQLTRYQLDGPWKIHEGVLKLAFNLVEARIEVLFDKEPWPHQGEAIPLRRLRRLYVSETTILNYLKAPALQEIAIYTRGDGAAGLQHPLESFLVRSACNLRRLCFRGSPIAREVSETLQKFTSITELAIVTCHPRGDFPTLYQAANAIIYDLTVDPFITPSGVLAPHLSGIDFGCESETYINYGLHLKMLESRWRAAECALKAAALVTESGPRPEPVTLAGFHSLCAEGLDLLLMNGSEGSEAIVNGWNYTGRWT
ncbi:hypothetical protein DFH09DRAFT_1155367 [Mycena vulgaris]|nr:hypothetical protein DFH09DRAFT_1155367 [Mycena vulgaris]